MPPTSSEDLVRSYLESMRAAEAVFEGRLRGFLPDAGDDLDLKAVFLSHADDAKARSGRLETRLAQISSDAEGSPILSRLAELPPTAKKANLILEERAVQDLISAFGIHSSECAMSEVLATVAAAGSDTETERLAREIQGQARENAERIFSLIRSRSKIAFNMRTVNERDPAIETKMADDRVI